MRPPCAAVLKESAAVAGTSGTLVAMATPLAPTATLERAGEVRCSTYAEHEAPAWCADLVECTWVGVAGWDRSLHVMPDGCVDLAWDGRALTLSPATETARRVDVRAGSPTVGVRLHPAAAAAVTGPVLQELRTPVALRDLWPRREVDGLDDELHRVSNERASAVLAAAVMAHGGWDGRGPDRRLRAAIEHLRRPATSVEQAAAGVGWSVRQLRRRCVEDVGLTPKALQQVLRFHRALQALGPGSLARVAVANGYADQAHLTRSFRRHAGAAPAALARRLRA